MEGSVEERGLPSQGASFLGLGTVGPSTASGAAQVSQIRYPPSFPRPEGVVTMGPDQMTS